MCIFINICGNHVYIKCIYTYMCVYIKTDHISITVKLMLFISTNRSIKRYNFD